MVEKVVGVYSFPKSGNTWMRHIIGKSIGDGSAYEVVPDIYTNPIWEHPVSLNGVETVFYKSHSKNETTQAHGRQFTNDFVLYIVRHPLDVFLSQLNYVSDNVTANPNIKTPCKSVDDIVAAGDLDLYFGAFSVYGTLQPQFADAGSWFDNALAWKSRAEADPDRVFIIRYEDVVNRKAEALEEVMSRVGITPEQLALGFDTAAAQTQPDGKFFWKQKAGNFLDTLPDYMIKRYCSMFRSELAKFNYDESGAS